MRSAVRDLERDHFRGAQARPIGKRQRRAVLEAGGQIRRAWLIPMAELSDVARVKPEKLSITPSAKEKSRDRYTPYRCTDMAAVARRLASYLDTRQAA